MPTFETDIQALCAMIDLQFAITTAPKLQTLLTNYERSNTFYSELSTVGKELSSVIYNSLSNPYKKALNKYFNDSGLKLFISLSVDLKIKQEISDSPRK